LEFIDLKSSIRNNTGKSHCRDLRRKGFLPAVLYGPKSEPMSLMVSEYDLDTIFKKSGNEQIFVNLIVQNGEELSKKALIKDFQINTMSRRFLHVDFYEVDMERKIKIMVPVVTVGKAKGVEDGGIFQLIRRELEVFCLPAKIPSSIELDVTNLNAGEAIHVEDIPLTEGVEIIHDVNFTIITILHAKAASSEEEAEGEEEASEGEAREAEKA
jgi:large subunit ribosomal protein L25